MGSGDLRPQFKGLYEEQRKSPDAVGRGNMTISRQLLVTMHQFLDKFMEPRQTELWKRLEEECYGDYSKPQFVRYAWELFWNALRRVRTRIDWNLWNPYWLPDNE